MLKGILYEICRTSKYFDKIFIHYKVTRVSETIFSNIGASLVSIYKLIEQKIVLICDDFQLFDPKMAVAKIEVHRCQAPVTPSLTTHLNG